MGEITHKVCSKCKVDRQISDFHRDKARKEGRVSQCKFCRVRKYTSLQHKKYAWIKRYGITPEEYHRILSIQNECCAICGKHQSEFRRCLAVDHDHTTNTVRGLLCMRCNLILGNALDTPTVLINAARYLERFK